MAEHNVNTVKAQIQSLINKANETTGNTDTNLTDGVNALVSGYGQGGSDGIEGGYDVTFYDENGKIVAFYSVEQGQSIKAPSYKVKSWETEDGTIIQFPYTPTSDLNLYANTSGSALEILLYEHFGVSKDEYPYIVLLYSTSNKLRIIFAKTIQTNTETELVVNDVMRTANISKDLTPTCAEDLVNAITVGTYALSSSDTMTITTTGYISSNFEILATGFSAKYRLDDVSEPLPYDGLANGYDVMFYDENNEGLAFYSIKQGHTINPPEYQVKAWQTSNGQNIEFPYTPTGDLILYANNSTLASQLYNYYGVDKGVYPYVFYYINGNRNYLTFAQTLSGGSISGLYTSGIVNVDFKGSTLDELVTHIMNTYPPTSLSVSTDTFSLNNYQTGQATCKIADNFDFAYSTSGTVYDLNQ